MSSASDRELRVDILTGRQVIVADGRAVRPVHVGQTRSVVRDFDDPFLEGNEHDTPDERLALRKIESLPNEPNWLLRVVANRYPAVDEDSTQLNSRRPHGVHDVVIECPDHRQHLTDLSSIELTRILFTWQTRLRQISTDPLIQSVCIFRNEGFDAGASLPHCHSQILATSFVGRQITDRVRHAETFHQKNGTSLFDTWLESERTSGKRIVRETETLVTVCPFASRTPWQTRFAPTGSMPQRFEQMSVDNLAEVAAGVLTVATTHRTILGDVGFNLVLILPPVKSPEAFPWMLDFLPRPGRFAGFELLSDIDILTVTPESAAQQIREHSHWGTPCDASHVLRPPGYQWTTEP